MGIKFTLYDMYMEIKICYRSMEGVLDLVEKRVVTLEKAVLNCQ